MYHFVDNLKLFFSSSDYLDFFFIVSSEHQGVLSRKYNYDRGTYLFYFRPKFGKVITLLDKHQFLDAVDKENPNVIVVVHLYSEVM